MGGKHSTTTSVQNADPWGPQQPYLQDIFAQAQNLYGSGGPQYYPGQTTASPTWAQQSALDRIAAISASDPLQSIPAQTAASIAGGNMVWANPAITPMGVLAWNNMGVNAPGDAALSSYVSGERLAAGNPYMEGVANSVRSRVVPQVQSQFINGGLLSSPEAARATAEGVASAIAPYQYNQYQQDEANQIAAANALSNRYLQGAALQAQAAQNEGTLFQNAFDQMLRAAIAAPVVQSSQYAPMEALFNAGSAQQGFNQQALNDAIARWNYDQTLPYNALNQYIGQVTGNYGGTTTLTQPYFHNTGQNLLTGGLGGAMLGSALLGPSGAGALGSGAASGIGGLLGALLMLG